VLYGSITGEDPRASTYVPLTMPPDHAQRIKAIAADTLAIPVPVPEPAAEPTEPLWCIADLP
jgi:hypothetical protein